MEHKTINDKLWFIFDVEHQFSTNGDRIVNSWLKETNNKNLLQDLPYSQMSIFFTVHRLGECSLTDLTKALNISKSSASQLVDRLVKKECLTRKQDESNRRKVIIDVKPEMKDYIAELDKPIIKWMHIIADKLGESDFNEWYRIMKKISNIFKELEEE